MIILNFGVHVAARAQQFARLYQEAGRWGIHMGVLGFGGRLIVFPIGILQVQVHHNISKGDQIP